MLNDRMLPWYEEHGVPWLRILTGRGSEYCGNREHHEFALYLARIFHASRTPGQNHSVFDADEHPASELAELFQFALGVAII